MTMSTMMTVSIRMNRTMTLTLIMIQLNLSRTPMYSSQAANSTGLNHQSQENYHDGTLLAHRSNLIDTETTAQSVQGYKYVRLRLRFSVCFRQSHPLLQPLPPPPPYQRTPPPAPPSPSSLQAWQ